MDPVRQERLATIRRLALAAHVRSGQRALDTERRLVEALAALRRHREPAERRQPAQPLY